MRMTTKALLVQALLGRPLGPYLDRLRRRGMGSRKISDEIKRETGVSVSHETIRGWRRG